MISHSQENKLKLNINNLVNAVKSTLYPFALEKRQVFDVRGGCRHCPTYVQAKSRSYLAYVMYAVRLQPLGNAFLNRQL